VADPACTDVLREIALSAGVSVLPFVCLKTRIMRTIDAAYKIKKAGKTHWFGERRAHDKEYLCVINPASMSSSVSIDVDIPREPIAAPRDVQALPPKKAGSPPRILAVDEDEEVLDLISLALDAEGVEVVTGDRGADVMALIEEHRPDAIMLDAMLPQVPGFDLCQRIKQSPRYQHIPVLIVSSMAGGWNLAQDVKHLFQADGFLVKPFQVATLLRWFEDALCRTSIRPRPEDSEQAMHLSAVECHRAITLYQGGSIDDALEAARRAVRADPFDARSHFVLGTVLNATGACYEAISQYERAANLAPSAFYPLKNLAIIYERQGFKSKAVEMWIRALYHCPSDAIRQTIKAHLVGLI